MQSIIALLVLILVPPVAAVVLHISSQTAVKGKVITAQGPLAGSKVRFQGESECTLTDAAGHFQLPPSKNKVKRITAWKEGFGIGAAPADQSPLELILKPLPAQDNDDYQWLDPTPNLAQPNNCGNCHQTIYQEWHTSAHGQSAKNKRFLNMFGGTDWQGRPSPGWHVLAEHPLGSAVCASCHAPTFSDPNLDYDMRKVPGVAAHGIHCDYCHKVVDAPTDKLGQRFGRDGLELLRPKNNEQLFFGPLDDAFREGETFGYLPLYKESRYCASCHEGVIFGVHVYGTYTEWLKSPAKMKGQQCQDCHMKPSGKMTNIAPGKGGIERDPLTLASHDFPGATAETLRQSLQVEVQKKPGKDKVDVLVTVTARNVGHRVPTGFIDRHLLLVVEGTDQDGENVPLLKGSILSTPAGKKLVGKPGFLYAKLLHSPDGQAPIPFWLPHGKMTDTRLHPEQPDRQEFSFAPGVQQVRVQLLYRRFWQEVAERKGWPDNSIVVFDKTWK